MGSEHQQDESPSSYAKSMADSQEDTPSPAALVVVGTLLGAPLAAVDASQPGAAANGDGGGKLLCQVADCEVDLRQAKAYCIKKRLCQEHLTAQAVKRRGSSAGWWRFCQQCGKLEPLEAFDGSKRSCRARLQKRRAHHNSVKNVEPQPHCRASQRVASAGDQKRQKADGGKKAQHSDGQEDGMSDGEEDYDDEAAGAAGSGPGGSEAMDMEVYSGFAGRGAAAAAAGAGMDPAAAAAAGDALAALGALATMGDYPQQQQQQSAFLQGILLASSMAGAASGNDGRALSMASGQLAAVQEAYAAAAAAAASTQPGSAAHDAARAASMPAAGGWAQAADGGPWGSAVQHGNGMLDRAASAGLPAGAPATAALAAVCAALADQPPQPQQQQQRVKGSVSDMQRQHSSQQPLTALVTDTQHHSAPIGGSTTHLSAMMAPSALQQHSRQQPEKQHGQKDRQRHNHNQHKHEQRQVVVKPELANGSAVSLPHPRDNGAAMAALAAANAAGAEASGKHAQLVSMLGHMLDQMVHKGEQDTAAAALAGRTWLASHSGDSVATGAAGLGAAAAAGGAAVSSAGPGSDTELPASGRNTPAPDSDDEPDAAAAAAAAEQHPSTAALAALAAATAAVAGGGKEGVAGLAAAGGSNSFAELGSLLQMGAGLCNSLGSAGLAASSALGQDVSTKLLATLFAQAPAAAAALMLAQQQQLQQLQAQQHELMKMLAAQQEQLKNQERQYQQQQAPAPPRQQVQRQPPRQQVERQPAASSDPFDVLVAAAAAAGEEQQEQMPPPAVGNPQQHRAPAHAQNHGNGSNPTQEVIEVVSAQLQTMAKQIAAALSPIQCQMSEFQAELHRMKGGHKGEAGAWAAAAHAGRADVNGAAMQH